MKTIKTYEDFVSEEINLKKALATGALAAGMAFSNPAISQTSVDMRPTQTSVDMRPTQSDRLPKSFSENHIKDIKLSGWENLKWGDSIETVKEKIPECKPYNQMIGSNEITLKVDGYEINGVDFNVFFIFDDLKHLKSVLLKNESAISQIRSFQEYFNLNYWEGNKSENKITWNGEMGDINVVEGTYQLPNSTTPNYNLTITYSESNNKAPIVSMTNDQKFDMLRSELIKMKDEQTEVKLNLYKCHKEFKVGVGLVGAGIGLGILGTAQLLNNPSGPGKEIAIIGSVLSLAGSIVIVDSHKFIAKASLTGIKVEFGGKPSYKKVQPGDYFLYMGPSK
jgi:hypothetical protein